MAHHGLQATPQNSSTSAGCPPTRRRAGRQREHDTTPGSSRSSPSKNRSAISAFHCQHNDVNCVNHDLGPLGGLGFRPNTLSTSLGLCSS